MLGGAPPRGAARSPQWPPGAKAVAHSPLKARGARFARSALGPSAASLCRGGLQGAATWSLPPPPAELVLFVQTDSGRPQRLDLQLRGTKVPVSACR